MDFGNFTIETPNSWKQIRAKVIDSYVGKIAIDDSDILHFDLGWYSNDLQSIKKSNWVITRHTTSVLMIQLTVQPLLTAQIKTEL